MRMLCMAEELKKLRFVTEAKKYMNNNPKTYSYGDLEPGAYFAVRFGLGDDCLLVFRIDPDCAIDNYQQILNRKNELLAQSTVAMIQGVMRNAENDSPEYDFGWDAAIERCIQIIKTVGVQ